jgi:hypothetical protein
MGGWLMGSGGSWGGVSWWRGWMGSSYRFKLN